MFCSSQTKDTLRRGLTACLIFVVTFVSAGPAFAQQSQGSASSSSASPSSNTENISSSDPSTGSSKEESAGSEQEESSSEKKDSAVGELKEKKKEVLPPEEKSMAMSSFGEVSGGANGSPNTIKQVLPDVDKTTGALTYTYQIKVPPGRNGIQPDLILGYNSLSFDPNSIFGGGWSLNIPYIKRINKKGIDKLYTENYFESSLSGELVAVEGSNTAYKSKVDNGEFLSYEFLDSEWFVTDKAGRRYTFGGNSSSTQMVDSASSTKIFAWALSEVRDLNSNYITYEYFKDQNVLYPDKIYYTNYGTTTAPFEIDFNRESRPNAVILYTMGFSATTTASYRVRDITIKHNGGWVKKYDLGYATSTTEVRSLLDTITESGLSESGTTTTLPAVDFAYSGASSIAFTQEGGPYGSSCPGTVNSLAGVIFSDINADGMTDIVRASGGEADTYLGSGTSGSWATSTTFASPLQFLSSSSTDLGVRLTDINGDGRTDMVKRISSSSTVYLGTSSGWSLDTSTSTWNIPVDIVNSDGTDAGVRILDLNGDGLSDFLKYYSGTTQAWLNNGSDWVSDSGWTVPAAVSSDMRGVIWGDVNNDGLIDIIYSYRENDQNWHRGTYLNNGNKGWVGVGQFNPPVQFVYGSTDWGVREADVNGDGYSDLIWAQGGIGGGQYIYRNTGTGFATSTLSANFTFVDGSSADTGARLADYTGDGIADVLDCNVGGGSEDNFWKNDVVRPDLLSQIKSLFGGVTAISYKPTTKFNSGGSLLNPELPFIIDAVETMSKGDGISPTSTQTFSYQGGRQYFASAYDRKMAGFSKMVSTDSASNATTYFFHQGDTSSSTLGEYNDEFSKIGKVYRTEIADSSGNVFSKLINKWDSATSSSSTGSYFVNLAQSVSMTYDGDSDHKDKAESYTYSTSTGDLLTKIEWGEASSSDDGNFSDVGTDNFTTSYGYAIGTSGTSTLPEIYTTSLFSDSGLVSYWRMEGNSNDSKGSNNGTDTSVSYSSGNGKFGQGAGYNGSSSKSVFSGPTFGASGTIAFWMKTDFDNTTNSSQKNIIDTSASPRPFIFYYDASAKRFGWDNPNSIVDPVGAITTNVQGEWHHWVFVWSGGNSEILYYDGSQIGSASVAVTTGSPASLYFGSRYSSSNYFPGSIDDVAIFSRALSSTEVSDLYNGESSFAINFSLPASETTVNSSSTKVRESRTYYDGLALGSASIGNATKQESWVSGSTYVSSTKAYNALGLVASSTDPRGKTTTYSYDTWSLYIATTTNPLSQSTAYSYDYSLGKPKQVTDANGLVFQTVFDGIDRIIEEKQPDLTTPSSLVTKSTTSYTDSYNASSILQTNYLDASTTVLSYMYFDGFGRTLQTRTEAEDSYIASDVAYNNLERLDKQSLPYFSSGSSKTTATTTIALYSNYLYDPLYRLKNTITSIGTTTVTYDDWKTTVTDPMGNPKLLYKDAYGNLKQVDETLSTSTLSTTYTYNYLQNLTGLTDSLGNVRAFTYDGLGLQLTAEDLHASGDGTYGSYSYSYDNTGNLIQQIDPKSQTINYTYDDIGRPLTEDYAGAGGTEVVYTYDSCTYGIGRLCTASSTDAQESSSYNALGLIASSTKTISATAYNTTYSYNRLGNVLETISPDSSRVKNTYNTAGLLETIERKESTDGDYIDVVTNFYYGPHGKIVQIDYANGAVTTNTYDSDKMYRLTRKVTTLPAGEEMMRQSLQGQEEFIFYEPEEAEYLESSSTKEASFEFASTTPNGASSTSEVASSTIENAEVATTTIEVEEASSTPETVSSTVSNISETTSSTDATATTTVQIATSTDETIFVSASSTSEYSTPVEQSTTTVATSTSADGSGSGETSSQTIQDGEQSSLLYKMHQVIVTGLTNVGNLLAEFFTINTAYASPLELYDTPLYSDSGLVSYWRMENNSNDAKGSNNGTDTSMSYTTSSGSFGYGGSFNGSTSKVVLSGPAFGSAGTITFWMKTNFNNTASNSNQHNIIDTSPDGGSNDHRDLIFYWWGGNSGSKFGWDGYNGAQSIVDPIPANSPLDASISGQWHLWTMTWSGASQVLYLDGAQFATSSVSGSTATPSNLYFGSRFSSSNYFPGALDDIAFFSRALSAEEASNLYTGDWSNGEVAIQDLNYSYDANNNITSITDFSTSNTAKKTDFTYDTLNRLLTASTTNATSGVNYYHSYSYDAIGNITSSTPSGAYGYTTTTTGYVNPHAAISVGTSTYTYDTNGNLASDGLWTHTWDYRNRLSQSTKTGATTTYGYDHANTRVKLVTASTTTIVPFSSYSTENGTAVKYISANGQLIATLRGTGTSTVAYYTHPDRLGSQEKSTDDTPSIVELTDYYPYGSQRQNTGSLNDRKGYIGVDLDSDTGLSQAGARYYKSNVGRFISQDPVFWEIGMTRDGRSVLSDPQAQNGYAYAGNNPITYKDPNGRFWKEIINPELREYLRAATSNRGYELSQSSPAWAWAIDHPYLTGLGVGLVGGAAYALPAATLYAADATGLILGPRVLSNLDKLDELPQTAGATQKLADLGSRLGQTPTQILSQASRFGQSFVDTRVGNLGNINILLQQTANTLTRITTNPQITRVISAGTMQTNGAANNVTNGNLVPLLNQLSGVLSTLSNYLGSLKK